MTILTSTTFLPVACAAISSSRTARSVRPKAECVSRWQMAYVSAASASASTTYLNGLSITSPKTRGRGMPGSPACPLVRSVQFMNTVRITTWRPNEATM